MRSFLPVFDAATTIRDHREIRMIIKRETRDDLEAIGIVRNRPEFNDL